MVEAREKDPVRVLSGRLGALATHARGHTNTAPAQRAFMARFEREVDPDGTLGQVERARRAQYALRDHMTRLVMGRHARAHNAKAAPANGTPEAAKEDRRDRVDAPTAA